MSPLQIFAKAPNQRTTILHSPYGDMTTTYDGRSGWLAAPTESKPAPVMALTGGNLEGAGVEAELSFPGQIKRVLGDWVVGPSTLIGDRDVRIVQGKKASGSPVKLYFEEESGLLARVVRYSQSPVGRVPTQIDYEDYREVSGIKIPFKWTSTWTDGRTVFELKSVQVNVRIDATRFTKPTPPAPPAIR
jgi:outer membrane lipoprotein-sorting protein